MLSLLSTLYTCVSKCQTDLVPGEETSSEERNVGYAGTWHAHVHAQGKVRAAGTVSADGLYLLRRTYSP